MATSIIKIPILPWQDETKTSSTMTIAAGGTAWSSGISIPSTWSNVILSGYYIEGTGNTACTPYCIYFNGTSFAAALKNNGSSQASVTIKAYFRHT